MTGVDVGASHGRPEYVIPALDLEGYFQRFFGERARLRETLGAPPARLPSPAGEPADPSAGIGDVESWIARLSGDPARARLRPWRDGVDLLQKKFAVFGRVQRSYGADQRKTTDEEVSSEALCRLATLLMDRHLAESELNSLNSAIKLLDQVASRHRDGAAEPSLRDCFSYALSMESDILGRLRHG